MSAFADSLILPALVLAAMGWLVPRLLALLFAEGIRPLMWLGFTATLIMFGIGIGFFVILYRLQGVPISIVFDAGWMRGLFHFGRLALISALLWAPIMVLSIAGLPKNWTKEIW